MFWWTFLLQIFCQLCFGLKDFIKIVRLILAAVSINGLKCKGHLTTLPAADPAGMFIDWSIIGRGWGNCVQSLHYQSAPKGGNLPPASHTDLHLAAGVRPWHRNRGLFWPSRFQPEASQSTRLTTNQNINTMCTISTFLQVSILKSNVFYNFITQGPSGYL